MASQRLNFQRGLGLARTRRTNNPSNRPASIAIYPTLIPSLLHPDRHRLPLLGFPNTPRLSQLRITRDQWHQFSLEAVNAATLTFREDAAAWATGVGTGAASSAFLLVFGPAVGYYTGKAVHKRTVIQKVKEKLAQDGELRNALRSWNEGSFLERGIQVWLEAPSEEAAVDVQLGMSRKDVEKEAKRLARRFRIVVQPCDPRSAPLGQGSWEIGQSPVSLGSGHQGEGWGAEQMPVKPYPAPVQHTQAGWGNQQANGHGGNPMVQELPGLPTKPYMTHPQQTWGIQQPIQLGGQQVEMAQELPGLAAPFIAELDGGNGNLQRRPEIPPNVPPKVS
ncbi:hypothetical protein F5882DRAFT_384469 [Hyaloscypha sp. PMI_1271]|nr:hypothetical protein F5882DRAFT_384469 [Hyaloscypha sp. PMI_1271]